MGGRGGPAAGTSATGMNNNMGMDPSASGMMGMYAAPYTQYGNAFQNQGGQQGGWDSSNLN
jgi:hypothetical protein